MRCFVRPNAAPGCPLVRLFRWDRQASCLLLSEVVDNVPMLDCHLISVHFPKAGGSAFRSELVATFGEASILSDYDCDPVDPTNPLWIDPEGFMRSRPYHVRPYRIVHGHFPIVKYDLVPEAYRVVMLREPIENLISIHYFWRSLFDSPVRGHATYEYVKRQRLSLLALAEIPSLRWLMSKSYFGGYDMRRFSVIGAHERRSEFFASISSLIGRTLDTNRRENITPISEERGNISSDMRLIARLRHLLQDDIRFYERHTNEPRRSWRSGRH